MALNDIVLGDAWEWGRSAISVDGELVNSMKRDGGFPEHATGKSAVRARIVDAPAV